MGGTFMSMPGDYRDYFIRNLHDALSGHSSSSVHEAVRYSEQVCRGGSLAGCLGACGVQGESSRGWGADVLRTLAHSCAVPHQVHRTDHRDAARLLPAAAPHADAGVRLHQVPLPLEPCSMSCARFTTLTPL